MFDERVYAAEGGLEGAKPIGGLFCNIEEYLHPIYNPLPLCWPSSRQRVDRTSGVEPTHIDLDPG